MILLRRIDALRLKTTPGADHSRARLHHRIGIALEQLVLSDFFEYAGFLRLIVCRVASEFPVCDDGLRVVMPLISGSSRASRQPLQMPTGDSRETLSAGVLRPMLCSVRNTFTLTTSFCVCANFHTSNVHKFQRLLPAWITGSRLALAFADQALRA